VTACIHRTARASAARRLTTIAAVLAGALLARPAAAQGAAPASARAATDTVALTVGEAVGRAARGSQEVRLARAAVDLAGTQVTAARAQALPQIDGTLSYTRTFASPFSGGGGGFTLPDSLRFDPDSSAALVERIRYLEENTPNAALGALGSLFGNLPFGQKNAYTAVISGTQVLYAGGRVGAALRIASDYRDASRYTFREEISDVEEQVRTAYWRAALAQELGAIAQAALDQAERFLAQERLRKEAGTASELEVLRAEVDAENLRPQLVAARNAAELALLDLKRLVEIPLAQPIRLTTPLTAPDGALLASVSGAVPSGALDDRPAVAAAEKQVEIRDEQVSIAKGSFLPSVSLRVNYGGQLLPPTTFGFSDTDWRKDVSATVGVSVPLFSGFRRKAELDQARVELERARLQLAQLREGVQLEYEQARGERERAATSIAARERTVQQAQRVHDLTVLRYEKGLATQLEVSDARLALLQARTNLAQAVADYHIADAALQRALGRSSVDVSAGAN
jgi:outer membrane protein TolC